MEPILVIGGTGMLGEPVARRLQADGFPVRILTRSPEKARQKFQAGFEVVAGDVEAPETLEAAMQGCQGVHINLHDSARSDLERVGAIHTAAAAAKVGIGRITYLSGASVTAENCWFPDTQARYEAEKAIQESGVPYTIFKATWFMEALPKFVRGGRGLVMGPATKRWHWVAAADYARMVAAAYRTPAAANTTLFVYGPQAYTIREALACYTSVVCPGARLMSMPFWVTAIFARLGRRHELQAALPFFRYCERTGVHEAGDPAEANGLLGAPAMTVEQWSRQRTG